MWHGCKPRQPNRHFFLFVLNRNTCCIGFYYFGSGAFLGSGSDKVFSFYEPKQRKQKTQIETWACERQRRLGNAKKTVELMTLNDGEDV